MYKKIVLTLDGSDVSRQAIPHAVTLAKQTGASVVLVQVTDSEAQIMMRTAGVGMEQMAAGQITADIAAESVAAERAEAEKNLATVKAQLASEGVTSVTTVIRQGYAGDEIVAVANEENADVVVIATHGRSGLSRVIMGSVADHVVRNASTASVLLVRAAE